MTSELYEVSHRRGYIAPGRRGYYRLLGGKSPEGLVGVWLADINIIPGKIIELSG